jgi:molecular chaperone HtpG
MTAEEIKKYINQVAFSGATEFMEKFKEAGDANEIIGRFRPWVFMPLLWWLR